VLSHNNLSGTVPSVMAQAKSLQILLLNDNQLEGSLTSFAPQVAYHVIINLLLLLLFID
jgi:hypothetical protein